MKSHRMKTPILSFSLILSILLVVLAPQMVSAQGSLAITGTAGPTPIKEGEIVRIHLEVTNNLGKDIDSYTVMIYIFRGTQPSNPDDTIALTLTKGSTQSIDSNWTAKCCGKWTISVIIDDDQGDQAPSNTFERTVDVQKVNPGNGSIMDWKIFGIPFIFLLVIIIFIVVVIIVIALRMKKRKKKGPLITGEGVEVTGRVAWGKMPENYYKEKRDRLAKMRPVGLTRDGRTILGNSQIGEGVGQVVAEVDHTSDGLNGTKTCQKCGYDMSQEWRSCMKCEAIANIKDTKNLMKEPIFEGHNMDFAETVVRQADAAFEGENFTDATVFALDARTKVEEYRRKVEADKKAVDETKVEAKPGPEEEKPAIAQGPKPPSACPRCGMGMQDGWSKCPVCGLTVEEMLKPEVTPQETPLVQVPQAQTYTCSTCGNEKESETAACFHCNTGRAITNAEKKVKELRLLVSTISLSSEDQLEVNEAFDLFADAKGAYQDKDYNTAVGLAGETIDEVDELIGRLGPKPQKVVPPSGGQPKPAPTTTVMAIADNKCPKCGLSIKPTWEICPQCNTQLRAPTPATAAQKTCPKCSKPVKDRWTICPFCENSLI
jgi:uncharacterized membrane protein